MASLPSSCRPFALGLALVSACSAEAVFEDGTGGSGIASTASSATVTGIAASSGSSGGDGGAGDGGASTVGATAGGGGRGGSGGEGGSGTAGASSSTGCVSDCGERRCGLDVCGEPCGGMGDTWAITVPEPVSRLVLDARSSSLYVIGERNRVDRVDVCLGESLAGVDVAADFVAAEPALRGVGVIGEELVLGMNEADQLVAVARLDRLSLQEIAERIPLPTFGARLDRIWGGAVLGDSLWLGLDDDGDGLIRVTTDPPLAMRHDFGTEVPGGRGSAATPFGFLQQRGDLGLALVPPATCVDTTCMATSSLPLPVQGFQVAYGDGAAFVPALGNAEGTLMRVSLPELELQAVVASNPGDGLDAFTDAAVLGTTVYVAGVSGGITGVPWLVRYPTQFADADPPQEEAFLIGAGDVAWAIVVDDAGIYVAGSRDTIGFVVKCTHDLQCPAIP